MASSNCSYLILDIGVEPHWNGVLVKPEALEELVTSWGR